MDLTAARRLGTALLAEHGLGDWGLVLDDAKTRAGSCRYGPRQISLSRPLTALHSPEQVRETLLHEIAHALAGAAAGHGSRWKAVARGLGCSASRCLPEDAPRVPGAWTGTCPAGHTATRHRRPERVVSCRQCAPRFSADAVLEWRHHGRPAPMTARYVAELAALAAGPAAPGAAAAGAAPGDRDAVRRAAAGPLHLPVGTRVRLGGGGRYAGLTGTVEKRGRTRYHVRTPVGVVTAPAPLVQPVPRGGDAPAAGA